VAIRRP